MPHVKERFFACEPGTDLQHARYTEQDVGDRKKIRHTATKTTPNKPSSIAACAEAIPLNKRDPLRLPDYDAEDEAEDPSRSHSLLLIQML